MCLHECECVCVCVYVEARVCVCCDVSVLTTPKRKMIGGMPLGDYQKNLSRWEI